MGCQTLTELIFGVEASQAGAGEEYTPEKLRELLEQLLPKDGVVTEGRCHTEVIGWSQRVGATLKSLDGHRG